MRPILDDIRALAACEPHDVELVGGKAVGLAILLREGFRVPAGFAVATAAYREFVSRSGLSQVIRDLLATADSIQAQADAATKIVSLFTEQELQPSFREHLLNGYRELGELPVAVRSSAISEDSAEASFAGQHETYLWIEGIDDVARAVVRCWASLFSPQALEYSRRAGIAPELAAMGVVVQAMVPAEAAGVMMTIDPLTGDPSQITIEAVFGLGVAAVAGEVTPDRYAVDKVTLEIRASAISAKDVAWRLDAGAGELRLVEVDPGMRRLPCISDAEVLELAKLGKRVEQTFGAAQDVEWAIGPGREIYLLQTRPETLWGRRPRV